MGRALQRFTGGKATTRASHQFESALLRWIDAPMATALIWPRLVGTYQQLRTLAAQPIREIHRPRKKDELSSTE